MWLGSGRTTEGTRRPGRMQVLKTWWCNAHDDMMKCTKANKTHGETRNSRKSSGASVSGRYNTPPLREDLVPRSRMAPEGQRKRKRGEVKLSCFSDKRVKPRTLRGWTNWKKWNNGGEQSSQHSVKKEEKKEPIRVALQLRRDARLDKMKRTWRGDATLRLTG